MREEVCTGGGGDLAFLHRLLFWLPLNFVVSGPFDWRQNTISIATVVGFICGEVYVSTSFRLAGL
jgi:hypothetical protein